MSDRDIDELGPIDYAVIEFPADRQPDGSALPLLRDLVERGIIRVLDLAFIRKETDGSIVGVDIADVGLRDDIDVTLFAEASSGLVDDDDLEEAGGVLEPGSAAAVLVYENTWAAPFARALRRNGAQLVASGRIPVQGPARHARHPRTRDLNPEEDLMPGLIRGVARTAVVAGTATAVSNRVSRRQGERWTSQQQPQYPHRHPRRRQHPRQRPAQPGLTGSPR